MEENNNTQTKSGGNKNLMIGGIIVAILVVVGGAIFLSSNNSTETPASTSNSDAMMEEETMEGKNEVMEEEGMMEDKDSMMEDDSMMGEAMQIEVEGGSYYFDPDVITVEAGQEVTITLNSMDMMHDFVIDELDVATEVVPGGETGSVTFTAPDKPGEYEFYCSVGNHRAQGMVGTLIVE